MRYILLVLLFVNVTVGFAQKCEGCRTTINNYVGNIQIRNNENVCLTGTFSGSIDLTGGSLTICGNAQVSQINFKNSRSSITIADGAIVNIQSINSNKETFITNYSHQLTIQGGNFNQPFTLVNNGKCIINGGNYNSTLDFTNTDSLIINTSFTLNRDCNFTNSKYFEINGNFNPNNGNVTFNNNCQLLINGDMNLNGQNLQISGGFFRVNNVNINSGSIVLNNSSIFYVNSINIGGFVSGVGSRSTMVCTQNPNLNRQASIQGELSVCVKTGNFNPNPGTVQAPATIDCNNPIGGSPCNPEPFGYPNFRMVPQVSNEWTNSATWEMETSMGWKPAPTGRFPSRGSAVLIGDGKQMTLDVPIEVNRLTLGQAVSAKLICDSLKTISITIFDSLEIKQQSQIELNNSSININGKLLSDLRIKGSPFASLFLNTPNANFNLVMDQNQAGTSNVLGTLSYNIKTGTLLLSDSLRISNIVIPLSGTLNTNNKLTLLSTNKTTATIAPGSGNYITGNVTVQNFIPSIARRFRFITSPVSNGTLLDWQQEVFITGNNASGNATGNTPGFLNSAGFDATLANATGMFFYDETRLGNLNIGWNAVTNETNTLANVTLPTARGYRLFIRGDRSDLGRLDGTNDTQNEVTLDMTGALNTGDITMPITFSNSGNLRDDGWNLIGNPYASAFDWKDFYNSSNSIRSGIEPSIWIYSARTNSYVSYNALAGAGSLTSGIIPVGQSFWVKAIADNPLLTFTEMFKVPEPKNFFRGSDNRNDELSLRLIQDSINDDITIIKYIDGALKTKDSFDIQKFWSSSVGIATFSPVDSIYMDLSSRPINYRDADFIQVYFFVSAAGNYTLDMRMSNGERYTGAKAYLIDDYTKQYIDIRNNPIYQFFADPANQATVEFNRFYIVYFPSEPSQANVNYLFAERTDSAQATIRFGTLSEPAPTTFFVQRGLNTTSFITLDTIIGTGSFSTPADYEFIDSTADFSNTLFYRIAYLDTISPVVNYSTVVKLDVSTGIKKITLPENLLVYPIPSSNAVTIKYKDGAFHGALYTEVYDLTGKLQLKSELNEPMPNGIFLLDISTLNNGFYFLHVTDIGGRKSIIKIAKQ